MSKIGISTAICVFLLFSTGVSAAAQTFGDEISEIIEGDGNWQEYLAGPDIIDPVILFAEETEHHTVFISDTAECAKSSITAINYGSWDAASRTCTLTDDVPENIEISADNIVLDCAAHTVTGAGAGWGIYLRTRTGVTIKECQVKNFEFGIGLLYGANNILLTNNNVSNNSRGIYLHESSNNFITNNETSNNTYYGTSLWSGSNDNRISGNNASGNSTGIQIFSSERNTVVDNETSYNSIDGIALLASNRNIVSYNTARGNQQSGFYLGYVENGSMDNIVASNTSFDNGRGILVFSDSDNTQVIDNSVSGNTHMGIGVYSSNNTVTGNTITAENVGTVLYGRHEPTPIGGNLVTANAITDSRVGISVYGGPSNTIFNNYFNNSQNVNLSSDAVSIWNTAKTEGINIVGGPFLGGNYWAAPDGTGFSETCADADGDEICDLSYILATGNVDNLPLASGDSDGDGIPDGEDACPAEDATGFDANQDGCLDTFSGLSQIIATLPDEVLSEETRNSLVSKVENAKQSSDKDVDSAAISQLHAFINEIEAQRDKKVSNEAADLLIAYALNIINQIEAS
jgi:parallel beta-helix repeat protein